MKPGRLQQRIISWLGRTYGQQTLEKEERSLRYAEESMELLQAAGVDKDTLLKIVDPVYSRPKGEVDQEVTGSYITLVGMCHAHGIDLHDSVDRELDRVEQIKDACRTKHDSKPSFMRTHDSKNTSMIRTLETKAFSDVIQDTEFTVKRDEFLRTMSEHLRSQGLTTSFIHRALSIHESVAMQIYNVTHTIPSMGLEFAIGPQRLDFWSQPGLVLRNKNDQAVLISAVIGELPFFDVQNTQHIDESNPIYGESRTFNDFKVVVFSYDGSVYKHFYVDEDGEILLSSYKGIIRLPARHIFEALCREVHIHLTKEIVIDSRYAKQESPTIKFIL